MVAKQLSIFLENKSGRLTEVTEVLAKEGVNLSALCIARMQISVFSAVSYPSRTRHTRL